ncbi:hypothetical protein H9P43_006048 [Blastocladiella emersonii ATCC 22665]|nr:hypothetical protein H9P43_006048 [Blastocladiella emersonii ATCC 22665]
MEHQLLPQDFAADYSRDRHFEGPAANIQPFLVPTLDGDARFAGVEREPRKLVESPECLLPLCSPGWRPRWATMAGDMLVLRFDESFNRPKLLTEVDATIARYLRILVRPRLGSKNHNRGGGLRDFSYDWQWERTWHPYAPAGFRTALDDTQLCALAWLYARETDPAARTFIDPDLRDSCPFVRLGPGGLLYNFARGEWAERDVWLTEHSTPLSLETRDSVLGTYDALEVLPAVLALMHLCPGREPGVMTVGSTQYVESRATLIVYSDSNVERIVNATTAALPENSRVLVLRSFDDYDGTSWDDLRTANVVVLAEALTHSGRYRARIAELAGANLWHRPLLRKERESVLGEPVAAGFARAIEFSNQLDDYLSDVVATGPAHFGPRVGEVVFERTWFHRVVLVAAEKMTTNPKEPTELDIGHIDPDVDLPADFFTSDEHAEARARAGYFVPEFAGAVMSEDEREAVIARAQSMALWRMRKGWAVARLTMLREAYNLRLAEIRSTIDLLGGLRGSFTVHLADPLNGHRLDAFAVAPCAHVFCGGCSIAVADACPACAIQFDATLVSRYPGGWVLADSLYGSKLAAVAAYLLESASSDPYLKAVVWTQFTGFARLFTEQLRACGISVTDGTSMPFGEAVEQFAPASLGGSTVLILNPESYRGTTPLGVATRVIFAHPLVAATEHAARELEMRLLAATTKPYRDVPVPSIKVLRFAAAGTVEAAIAERRMRAPWDV